MSTLSLLRVRIRDGLAPHGAAIALIDIRQFSILALRTKSPVERI